MFKPKTSKISDIATNHKKVITSLERLLEGDVCMYIDYANVRPWSEKLKWHVDLKRLKQFLDSFSNIKDTTIYNGILEGNEKSEQEAKNIEEWGYVLRTKPVKIMKFSIKASAIPAESPAILTSFIKKSLLRKYTPETIEFLNKRFQDMNTLGEYFIEDRKCNFDVEMGIDMLLDAHTEKFKTCVVWSGDSDFHDPIQQLLQRGKRVLLFATSGRVARELNALREEGLIIFDIQKIRNFICWNREIQKNIQKQKGPAEAGCP